MEEEASAAVVVEVEVWVAVAAAAVVVVVPEEEAVTEDVAAAEEEEENGGDEFGEEARLVVFEVLVEVHHQVSSGSGVEAVEEHPQKRYCHEEEEGEEHSHWKLPRRLRR